MQRPHFFHKKKAADANYNTPDWLFGTLNEEFKFTHDLAAVERNAKAKFFSDSLIVDWHMLKGWLWLNPPFAGIRTWVERSYEESLLGARIVVLVPSSVSCGPYMERCQPQEMRFVAGAPVFKNTFTEKIIRFPPLLLIYDRDRRPAGKFKFIAKPK